MKKILKYLRSYTKECILAPLFKLLEATFELFVPLVVAAIVDVGIEDGDRSYIIQMVLVLALLGIIGLVCAVTAQFFAAKAAVGFSGRLRSVVMSHILGLGYGELDRIGTSTLITRMTSDINQVQNGVNLTLRLLLRSPFVVFGAMIMAFTIDFHAALVFAVVIPVLCLIVFGIMLITMPMYKHVQVRLDRVTAALRGNLAGVRVLRAFCKEKEQVKNFDEDTQALTDAQTRAGRVSALMNPVTLVVINLAVITLVHKGYLKVEAGILTQGMVIALYNYMSQILVELVKMANLIISMTKAVACGNRVASVLETESAQKNGESAEDIRGNVTFSDVSFQYQAGADPSLEHISFTAQPGQTIGIIGPTGSGKTSLVNLIPRFYDATSGTVTLDGADVRSLDMQTLRRQVSIVPQKAVLFQGTIRENLHWGDDSAPDDVLWWALEIAQAREVVKDKDGELDAMVEQGGANFSGGQKQRLCIARALVRKPKILILDDSASALDYATDAALRKAIASMQDAPTTFIVSQRAASVRFADLILVLEDGKLVGKGRHEDLLAACPVYQEIFYSQFPGEVGKNG